MTKNPHGVALKHGLRWQPARFGKMKAHCSCGAECPATESEGIGAWFRDHTPRLRSRRRYCGPCDTYTTANPCRACGADTDPVPVEA